MRRRLTEQPRMVAAQMLITLAVLAGAVYLGTQIADGPKGRSRTPDTQANPSREGLRAQRSDTPKGRRDADRLRARIGSQRRRAARLERRSRALKRSLDRARRRLAQRGPR